MIDIKLLQEIDLIPAFELVWEYEDNNNNGVEHGA